MTDGERVDRTRHIPVQMYGHTRTTVRRASLDHVEHFMVQLNGSDRSPRAPKVTSTSLRLDVGTDDLYSNKTTLRQMFTMRHYTVERDGRLTSLVKAIEWVS